jgi:hypothetical protein
MRASIKRRRVANSSGSSHSTNWGRLIQRAGLLLQQRQIVNGIKDNILPVPAPAVAGNHISTTANDNLIDIAPDPNVTVAIGNRHRIIIGFVAHQGLRVHLTIGLVTGIKR